MFIITQELTRLPPFGHGNAVAQRSRFDRHPTFRNTQEMATCKMDQMGFDPLTKSSNDLLAFMENCEAIEDYDTTSMTVAHKPSNSKNGNNKGAKPSDPKKQK